MRVDKEDVTQVQALMQAVDAKVKEHNGPWSRLKQKLQVLLAIPAEILEEVIDLNTQEDRHALEAIRQEAERLREQAAAQQQANEAA